MRRRKNNNNDEKKKNTVVVTQRVFIDQIYSPTNDWKNFNDVFDTLQKECIVASQKTISIYNIYASYMLNYDEETANQFIMDNYNKMEIDRAAYSAVFDKKNNLCYSKIIDSIVGEIDSKYLDEKSEFSYINKIRDGEGNPPMTFTKKLPIPLVRNQGIGSVKRSENKNSRYYDFEFPLLSRNGKKWFNEKYHTDEDGHIRFGVCAKSDYVYEVLENIICGNYQLCDSELKRVETKKKSKDKNGKHRKYEYILLLAYRKPKTEHLEASTDRILGVDLGIKVPACCGVNFNEYYRKSLGSDKIIRENVKQEKINRKLQRDVTYNCRDGHGRTTKLDGWDGKGHKIANRNDYYNHMLAKKIVENAVKWNCGEIHIEDLTKIKNYTNNKFLKHWTYFDLQQKITYKAEAEGIVVKKINPYHTSQVCSFCGHFEPGQRLTQSQFICKNPECKNYQKPINADFNASRNIAKSTDFTEPKWKKQKKIEDNA